MKSFLTERQIQVLKMREKGLKHKEIAEEFGTTRSNVYILEKKAKENLKKAKNTIRIWREIRSVLEYEIRKDKDVFEIPEEVYREADHKDVKIDMDSTEMVNFLREKGVVNGRRVNKEGKLFVLKDGSVTIELDLNKAINI